jgi:uncharacterized protein (TIGR02598 family)
MVTKRFQSGFSLVEVVLALGIVSFSLLPMLALLPTGLESIRESANETALSAIIGKARAELNLADWSQVSGSLTGSIKGALKGSLKDKRWFFDESGKFLPEGESSPGAFYELGSSVNDAQLVGGAPGFAKSARRVTFLVKYPMFAPPENQKTYAVALLVARQSSR